MSTRWTLAASQNSQTWPKSQIDKKVCLVTKDFLIRNFFFAAFCFANFIKESRGSMSTVETLPTEWTLHKIFSPLSISINWRKVQQVRKETSNKSWLSLCKWLQGTFLVTSPRYIISIYLCNKSIYGQERMLMPHMERIGSVRMFIGTAI